MTAADTGRVTFEVDGDTYTLRFDMNAVADHDEQFGRSVAADVAATGTDRAHAALRRLMVSGLRGGGHAGITKEVAGELLGKMAGRAKGEAPGDYILKAVLACFPEWQADDGGDEKASSGNAKKAKA